MKKPSSTIVELLKCDQILPYRTSIGVIFTVRWTSLILLLTTIRKPFSGTRQPARAYHGRGMAYGAKGDIDKAIEDFTKAIQYEPDHAEAYYHRGNSYVIKDEFDRAIEDCDKAIQLNPDAADAYLVRGNAYSSKGEIDFAIMDYSKAIRLKPDANAYARSGERL